MSDPKLTQFKAILFDVYGTLVDWETGIYEGLKPMLQKVGSPLADSKKAALQAYINVEADLQAKYPTMLYADILAHIHAEMRSRLTGKPSHPETASRAPGITELSADTRSEAHPQLNMAGTSASAVESPSKQEGLNDEDIAFGKSIPKWKPFPDTIPALATLSKYYKLAPLSNVDRESFAGTREVLCHSIPEHQFEFDAVYTAQDIGSYKPDPANFEYALKRLNETWGIQKDEVLVVAQSRTHDHVPANQLGLHSVFIDRQGAIIGEDLTAKWDWTFPTLGQFAEAVQKEQTA